MDDFSQTFEDRLSEIEDYLDLLDSFDHQIQAGVPRIGVAAITSTNQSRPAPTVITTQQQKILYSSVYLQLYNLVEATISLCVEALIVAIENRQSRPRELSNELMREWVRAKGRTHKNLNVDNRLSATLDLCHNVLQDCPVSSFVVEKGGGGNWDDNAIEDITNRLGLRLQVSPQINTAIKRPFREDQGALVFIKDLRNKLAHGSVSFVESGEGITTRELHDLKERTADYLRQVVGCFKAFIDGHHFLAPQHRPHGAGP